MQRQAKIAVLINSLMAIAFVAFNIPFWRTDYYSYMDPLTAKLYGPYYGLPTTLPNLFFWMFWLSTIINIYFILRLQKSK
jgi:hypothetical protein